MLIFLIFRAEAYTCWSARFARSRVVGDFAVILADFGFFFGFWYFFNFQLFFGFEA